MSYYTDDAVKAKLSSLNDTHDSVVNVAQWLLFHRFVASAFGVNVTHFALGDTQLELQSSGFRKSKTRPL